ncbi:MAG: aldo/keto reductase [Propionicimonas sp.]
METRKLGSRGPLVSVLGVGCWSFGGGTYWGPQSQQDVDAVVNAALDAGVTLFDTAEVYNDGASERSLGKALGRRRDEALIVSKAGPHHAEPDLLRAACDASLARLRTDRIDVYMFHWPIEPTAIAHFLGADRPPVTPARLEDAFAAMAELREQGKIRHIGVSNFGARQLAQAAGLTDLVADELPYNLLSRAVELEVLPEAQRQGIGIIGYMALQQGLLAGKYTSAGEVPAAQAHSRHFAHARGGALSRHHEAGAEAQVFTAIERLRTIADDLQLSMSTLALSWVLARPGVSSVLVGSRNERQLMQNLRAADTVLDPETIEELDALTRPVLDALGSSPDYYENRARSRVR